MLECPFDIDLPDNESDDDPYYDADEKLMEHEKTNTLNKVDDFEAALMRKLVGLFHITDRESAEARRQAEKNIKIYF